MIDTTVFSSVSLESVVAKAIKQMFTGENVFPSLFEHGCTTVCSRPHAIHHIFVSPQFGLQFDETRRKQILEQINAIFAKRYTVVVTHEHEYGGIEMWHIKVEFLTFDTVDPYGVTLATVIGVIQENA